MNESELILTELLRCPRDNLYLNKNLRLNRGQKNFLAGTLKRRLLGEPIQYILGKTEFMGLEFKVSGEVFIPRPETEVLVETVIKTVNSRQSLPARQAGIVHNILDIGTGSGCIAISLAKFLKDVKIYATDISKEALRLAKKNALLNNVEITFLKSDLFSELKLQAVGFDLIVSNPPYIPTDEISQLQSEIACEPRIALDGGRDGLSFYRRIIKDCQAYIERNGLLFLEIGFNQYTEIKKLFTPLEKTANRAEENSLTGFNTSGKFEIIELVKDYSGFERVIVAKYG